MKDRLFWKLFFGDGSKVTDEEVEYFQANPEEIDEFTAPLNIHRFFLTFGACIGIVFVGVSKLLKFQYPKLFSSPAVQEFVVDIIFEIGVSFIGASVTAYLLVVLLKEQQNSTKKWRSQLRKRIKKLNKEKKP
ncbi:MAG: hypothetical protein AAF518_23660 [Spirochaetota bacterium]